MFVIKFQARALNLGATEMQEPLMVKERQPRTLPQLLPLAFYLGSIGGLGEPMP